jgi:hypothetical protein
LPPGYGALLIVIENRMPRPGMTYSAERRTGKPAALIGTAHAARGARISRHLEMRERRSEDY